jgi:hypothetical protein
MKIKNNKTGKMEDKRLPKAFKNKWIKALRSGQYKQVSGFLKKRNEYELSSPFSYCCLGVAGELCGVKGLTNCKNEDVLIGGKNGLKNMSLVPDLIKGSSSSLSGNPVVKKLVDMNDSGKSFKVIAKWIEKNL